MRARALLRCTLLAACALAGGGGVAAQDPVRSGFWAEAGAGAGYSRTGCAGCDDVTRRTGSTLYLRAGAVLTRRVALGIESFVFLDEGFSFRDDEERATAEHTSLAAVVLWSPFPWPVHAKGGLGIGAGRFTIETEQGLALSEGFGPALHAGLGADLPLGRRLALGAGVAVYVTATGDVVLPSGRVEDVIATLWSLTAGLTLR